MLLGMLQLALLSFDPPSVEQPVKRHHSETRAVIEKAGATLGSYETRALPRQLAKQLELQLLEVIPRGDATDKARASALLAFVYLRSGEASRAHKLFSAIDERALGAEDAFAFNVNCGAAAEAAGDVVAASRRYANALRENNQSPLAVSAYARVGARLIASSPVDSVAIARPLLSLGETEALEPLIEAAITNARSDEGVRAAFDLLVQCISTDYSGRASAERWEIYLERLSYGVVRPDVELCRQLLSVPVQVPAVDPLRGVSSAERLSRRIASLSILSFATAEWCLSTAGQRQLKNGAVHEAYKRLLLAVRLNQYNTEAWRELSRLANNKAAQLPVASGPDVEVLDVLPSNFPASFVGGNPEGARRGAMNLIVAHQQFAKALAFHKVMGKADEPRTAIGLLTRARMLKRQTDHLLGVHAYSPTPALPALSFDLGVALAAIGEREAAGYAFMDAAEEYVAADEISSATDAIRRAQSNDCTLDEFGVARLQDIESRLNEARRIRQLPGSLHPGP